MNKIASLVVGFSACFLSGAHAITVFPFDAANTTPISNNVNGGAGVITTLGGITTVTTTSGNNNNSGFTSTDDIMTALGRSVLPTETVIVELVVDGITGNLSANGIEFGLSPNNNGFRPTGHLLGGPRANGQAFQFLGNNFTGTAVTSIGATEGSLLDGFSATLTADAAGYSLIYDDVVPLSGGGTSIGISGTFTSPAQFTSLVDGSHFYLGLQKTGTPDLITTISLAQITVIPEPSRALLLAVGLIGLATRRRRS